MLTALVLENGDKHHFFWLFESRHDPENDPVILWMSGYVHCRQLEYVKLSGMFQGAWLLKCWSWCFG